MELAALHKLVQVIKIIILKSIIYLQKNVYLYS